MKFNISQRAAQNKLKELILSDEQRMLSTARYLETSGPMDDVVGEGRSDWCITFCSPMILAWRLRTCLTSRFNLFYSIFILGFSQSLGSQSEKFQCAKLAETQAIMATELHEQLRSIIGMFRCTKFHAAYA